MSGSAIDVRAPRERPILFSAPMVRAIMEGRKTQTRRPVKTQPPEGVGRIDVGRYNPAIVDCDGELQCGPEVFGACDEDGEWGCRCPYGEPGDLLWVRETWSTEPEADELSPTELELQDILDGRATPLWYAATDITAEQQHRRGRWRSPIHMLRWVSRITLRMTTVRVERLQAITEEDARAEGARHLPDIECRHPYPASANRWSMFDPKSTDECLGSARTAFGNAWCVVHDGPRWNLKDGPSAWDLNPWVWVIGFERVEVPHG